MKQWNWGGLVFAAAMIALVVVSGWVTERLARWAEGAGKEAEPEHVPLPVCDNMRETAVVPEGRGFWSRLPRERTGLREELDQALMLRKKVDDRLRVVAQMRRMG